MRRAPVVAALLLTPLVASCDSFVDVARDLNITITADRQTLPVGENVRIDYQASGGFLTRVAIDFGDGSDQAIRNPGGAQTASGNVLHAYAVAGTYTVTGIALDGSGDRDEMEIAIEVTDPNP